VGGLTVELVRRVPMMREISREARGKGKKIGFVPTMGALHDGHLSLVRRARELADIVVVSIFVNPKQFGPDEDYDKYPRDIARDADLCLQEGADVVFAPSVEEIYPAGAEAPPAAPHERPLVLPDVATMPGLEDAHRPGHFAGVCRVVSRLFDLVKPRLALFGEKDWQQLQVIRAMCAMQGRDGELTIVPSKTVRETGASAGLALSSRNVFLSPADRVGALSLSKALCEADSAATIGEAEAAMSRVLSAAGVQMEYAVVRDAQTLMPLPAGQGRISPGGPMRALIAARVGRVRLIDNAPWGSASEGF